MQVDHTNNFCSVPEEIQLHIFSFLRPKETLLISHDWYRLSMIAFPQLLMYQLAVRNTDLAEDVIKMIKKKKTVNDLNIIKEKINKLIQSDSELSKYEIEIEIFAKYTYFSLLCNCGDCINCGDNYPFYNYHAVVICFHTDKDSPRMVFEGHNYVDDPVDEIHCARIQEVHGNFYDYVHGMIKKELYDLCMDAILQMYEVAKIRCSLRNSKLLL